MGNDVGIYGISVRPHVRGRHDLIVNVKGKEIAGSPFRVFVKYLPSQLVCKQFREVCGFWHPWGIAVNDKQQLLAVESGVLGGRKKITVIERDGKMM